MKKVGRIRNWLCVAFFVFLGTSQGRDLMS